MPPYRTHILATFLICFMALPLAGVLFDRPFYSYALSRLIDNQNDSAPIREAVTAFNNYLMDIYASRGAAGSIDAIPATTAMRHRLFKDAGFIGIGGRVLVYDLASLAIEKVTRIGPVTAEVVTTEEWNYQYKDGTSWKPVSELHGIGVRFRYTLLQKKGIWMVHKYEPLREKGKT